MILWPFGKGAILYGDPSKLPPVRLHPNRAKSRPVNRPAIPVSLTRSLIQGLTQGLFSGLYQGVTPPSAEGLSRQAVVRSPSSGLSAAPSSELPDSGVVIRKVSLLAGESIRHTFVPEQGLVPGLTVEGRMLVLTNQRIMAFGQRDGLRETVLMPLEEVKAVAVVAGRRGKGTLFQGGLMVVAAVFFYVLLAYWLTGRIDGPTVPIIRMDLVAFVVFLAVLTSVAMMAQVYFGKPDGEVTFQGDGVKLTFPFRGEPAENDMHAVVNASFAARQFVVAGSKLTAD